MNDSKEIFLPDTTISVKSLKKTLSDVYGLDVISKNQKYILYGSLFLLSISLIYILTKDSGNNK
jgi:hypothetical protein